MSLNKIAIMKILDGTLLGALWTVLCFVGFLYFCVTTVKLIAIYVLKGCRFLLT